MSAVVCEALSLNNGNVEKSNGNREGSEATHRCNEGFLLSGDAIQTCQSNGEWTGSTPTCVQGKTCKCCRPMSLCFVNNIRFFVITVESLYSGYSWDSDIA